MSSDGWGKVGEWLKTNGGQGVALVGSLLTGNVPGAIAAGAALVSSATGVADPGGVLARLQQDPATVVRLKELQLQDEASIREHLRTIHLAELADKQSEHHEQQETIRTGDTATDEYVRRTRPKMARQSWYATMGYVIVFEAMKAVDWFGTGAVMELAMVLIAPAAAYLGFRTLDKHNEAKLKGAA